MSQAIDGFSKLSKEEKIRWIATRFTRHPEQTEDLLKQYWNTDPKLQRLHDEFIENTLSNFYLPLGVAPNFSINGKMYAIPMAIEESSVVAAASKAAKYWMERGGIRTRVLGTEKIGQVHFSYNGKPEVLEQYFAQIKPLLLEEARPLTRNMEKRGGGILDIQLRNLTESLPDYYQLHCSFDTRNAMGANFVNSCLEQFAATLVREAATYPAFGDRSPIEVQMSILSNYVPHCLVRAEVSCPASDLQNNCGMDETEFARKIVQAVRIADVEPYRAVTHNKGIMNGVDAVVIATGNDFRAVEAGVHAYASRSGSYRSLSGASVEDGIFRFWLELPLALGTVGGLTGLHPMVKLALEILGNPSATELMEITAAAGLAQNFAALGSLVTVGIQQGHMKMHLMNILNQLGATAVEKEALADYFQTRSISHSAVEAQLGVLRKSR